MPQVATPVYRAIMVELERKRLAMGISMDRVSELMGAAERSYAKMLYPETSSGRQAGWEKLQQAVDVLFAEGFEVVIRPGATKTATTVGTKSLIRSAAAHFDGRTQREVMREIGRKGGKIGGKNRWDNVGPKARSRITRAAAQKRWSTPVLEELPNTEMAKQDAGKVERQRRPA